MPRKWLLGAAAALVALLLAATAALISRELVSSSGPSKPTARKSRGFVRFQDPETGFSLAYPRSWRRLPSPDRQVRLIAAGGAASLLVRTAPFELTVTPETLTTAKRETDELVRSVKGVKILRKAEQVELGGLPGYLYLYTFNDQASGQRGAHAHYFVFRGRTMFTLVFQAVPANTFGGLAPLFDRIGNSFRAGPAQRRQ